MFRCLGVSAFSKLAKRSFFSLRALQPLKSSTRTRIKQIRSLLNHAPPQRVFQPNEPRRDSTEVSLNAPINQPLHSSHKKNRLLVNCTQFDSKGNVSVVSADFKKMDLCRQHSLLPRDLRKLDTGVSSIVPVILVRSSCILINLLHVRAIIKADTVLLFDVYGSTSTQMHSRFIYELEGRLRKSSSDFGSLPYEMRALEAILVSVVATLDTEMMTLQTLVSNLLSDFELDIRHDRLRALLRYSKRLSEFKKRATMIRNTLDETLEQDEDLAGMYLTEKLKNGKSRPMHKHEEVELLLETYYKQVEEIVQRADSLSSSIKHTEEVCNIVLDANRNALMIYDLKLSVLTMSTGLAAVFAGLFGMNLVNGYEESPCAFVISSVAICSMAIFTGIFGVHRIRKLNKVQMQFYRKPLSREECNFPYNNDSLR
ncbi:magnesium ion transporter Mrs2 [Schizosaccharomyces japonicus yFS275]|uniref:Magnesium transporter n=1 Tax=Schizosaccharomyces japonicus (strain yFS275 / FY16936) TaxID=402676 RepID=B6JYH8_SCHJY|nr:magnesium ion transporter Mrs2 [Schizosaccharomyces japonicus yFS275]EEB06596.1 magnesium ion transporter Mrs2 [Schizosaccharomyces japonicus yFS275]